MLLRYDIPFGKTHTMLENFLDRIAFKVEVKKRPVNYAVNITGHLRFYNNNNLLLRVIAWREVMTFMCETILCEGN